MYMAVKFRKIRESKMTIEESDDEEEEDDDDDDDDDFEVDPQVKAKLFPMALMTAKKSVGDDAWKALSSDERTALTDKEVRKLAKAKS